MRINELPQAFFSKFMTDRTLSWAASVAYYMVLSLSPLVVLFLIVISHLDPHLQNTFVNQIRELGDPNVASGVEMVIHNSKTNIDLSHISGVFGAVVLLLSAGMVFSELKTALTLMFRQVPTKQNTKWQFILDRFKAMGLALGFIVTIILSLMLATAISSAISPGSVSSAPAIIYLILNILASSCIYFGLFTLWFHYLPEQDLPWKQAAQGGLITAVLFVLGKVLIGIYLGNSAFGSAYGAAGSLVILLVWIYYSAVIMFTGAHVSYLLNEGQRRPLARNF
jgi:membrane protein